MFRFYTPILILQVFCIYHAYKTGRGQTWYYLIVFLPVIGCALYLYDTFATRKNLEDLSEGLKQTVNSNRKIELLEKKRALADTTNNRMKLADAYLEIGRIDDAIELYNLCLEQQRDNKEIIQKLIHAYFFKGDYTTVIQYAKQLKDESDFRNSEARIAYAWALHYAYDSEKAAREFEAMDVQYSNYKHRFEYARFLSETDKAQQAKTKIEELITEYRDMPAHERRFKKEIYREARELYHTLR